MVHTWSDWKILQISDLRSFPITLSAVLMCLPECLLNGQLETSFSTLKNFIRLQTDTNGYIRLKTAI